MGRKVKVRPEPAAEPEEGFVEWQARLTVREQRVREIVGMMLRGAWVGGVSDELLAKKWNCTPPNVRQISAEASRTLRAQMRDDPNAQKEARALMLAGFEAIRMRCMAKGDAPSMRVALDAMRAYGFYLGIEPAKRLDVTERHDPVEGWSVEEKIAYARDGKRPRRALREHANGADEGDGGSDDPIH